MVPPVMLHNSAEFFPAVPYAMADVFQGRSCRDPWSWNSPFSPHFLSLVMKYAHTDVLTGMPTDVDMNGASQAGIAHVLRVQAAAPQGQLAADVGTAQHAIGMQCAEPHPKGSTATDHCAD